MSSEEIESRKKSNTKARPKESNQDYTNSINMMQVRNHNTGPNPSTKHTHLHPENNIASTDHSEFDSNYADAEDMIHEIRSRCEEEKEKILLMKTKYIQKLDDKNELEKLLAKCINDYKEELWAIKSKMKFVGGMGGDGAKGGVGGGKGEGGDNFEMEIKETIREILNIEKQLSLLYDKVFYTKGHVSMTTTGGDAHLKMC
jgi:hypothetical protein